MPEIIVTAEKRSSSVNKVPLSMNVFNGTQLATAGVHSTEDLAKVVPGFSTVTSFYGAPVYYLRGVGFYDNSVAARPAVTIYADEAPIPYSVMAMGTTLDLERVEVLKAAGTLFGSNSTGGAINFIAAKPGKRFEAAPMSALAVLPMASSAVLSAGPCPARWARGWRCRMKAPATGRKTMSPARRRAPRTSPAFAARSVSIPRPG
jgi:outer membrane receptor protein involved in Fe transport